MNPFKQAIVVVSLLYDMVLLIDFVHSELFVIEPLTNICDNLYIGISFPT